MATRINKPLWLWRKFLSGGLGRILAKLWPWVFILAVLAFLIAVEIAIFGAPLSIILDPDTAYTIQSFLALWMFALTLLSIPVAFAHDIQTTEADII